MLFEGGFRLPNFLIDVPAVRLTRSVPAEWAEIKKQAVKRWRE
jgi:hypothetical protein